MHLDAWEQVPVPLIARREDGRVVAVNTAAATALGHTRESLLASSYWTLTLSGQKQCELALVQRGEVSYGKEFLRADGEPVTVSVIGCAPLAGDDECHVRLHGHQLSSVYLAPLGIGAMLEAPIRRMGRPVGVLCSEHVGPPSRSGTSPPRSPTWSHGPSTRPTDGGPRRRSRGPAGHARRSIENCGGDGSVVISQRMGPRASSTIRASSAACSWARLRGESKVGANAAGSGRSRQIDWQ